MKKGLKLWPCAKITGRTRALSWKYRPDEEGIETWKDMARHTADIVELLEVLP